MRARIELSPQEVADVLREYIANRRGEYISHEHMPDDGIEVIIELSFDKSVAAPRAASAVRGVPARGVPVQGVEDSPIYPSELREDQKRPPDAIRDGLAPNDTEEFIPPRRVHNKEVDLEFANILAENVRLIEEAKQKKAQS